MTKATVSYAAALLPVIVKPMPEGDGGGYLAVVPALEGCYGDGETTGEALDDARNAILEWLDENWRLQSRVHMGEGE